MVDGLPVERKGGVFIKTDTGEKFSPAAGLFVSAAPSTPEAIKF